MGVSQSGQNLPGWQRDLCQSGASRFDLLSPSPSAGDSVVPASELGPACVHWTRGLLLEEQSCMESSLLAAPTELLAKHVPLAFVRRPDASGKLLTVHPPC